MEIDITLMDFIAGFCVFILPFVVYYAIKDYKKTNKFWEKYKYIQTEKPTICGIGSKYGECVFLKKEGGCNKSKHISTMSNITCVKITKKGVIDGIFIKNK